MISHCHGYHGFKRQNCEKERFLKLFVLAGYFLSVITDMIAMCSLHAIVYLFVDTSRSL